ncbi:hypothetical protein BJY52DRAFT_196390 [Lactarius psammicola]|nr:hypothetical protein BJY52DRAFT_196390 [Lactarius psammicola]
MRHSNACPTNQPRSVPFRCRIGVFVITALPFLQPPPFFFSNPFLCALGYRTLCSTSLCVSTFDQLFLYPLFFIFILLKPPRLHMTFSIRLYEQDPWRSIEGTDKQTWSLAKHTYPLPSHDTATVTLLVPTLHSMLNYCTSTTKAKSSAHMCVFRSQGDIWLVISFEEPLASSIRPLAFRRHSASHSSLHHTSSEPPLRIGHFHVTDIDPHNDINRDPRTRADAASQWLCCSHLLRGPLPPNPSSTPRPMSQK